MFVTRDRREFASPLKAVRRLTGIWAMLTLVLPVVALAQGVTGTLSGTVKDAQGGVIPGASVTLLNEQGTRSSPVITNATGDFVAPNLPTGTYTVTVEMSQFKTLNRPGVVVSSGSRVSVGTLVIEVGGASEVVTVTSEIPLVQASSGERSFSVTTESVANLPVQNRSYFGLLALAPGVVPGDGNAVAIRLGGGGNNNYMIDGAVVMDPSINRPMANVSVEAIAEVKVQTSAYAAEYGRASGLQVNAVTKSGTNRFHGSLYDVERDSRWNSNNKANILVGAPKTQQDERDWGFAIGGPVGKPGGNNKLFFYFNYEANPRLYGKDEINRYRMPTELERQGDFSKSLDNNGNLYPYIKDYLKTGSCNATSQAACFADGGVVGRIPADRLYQPGVAILKWYPMPNVPDATGLAYNMNSVYPGVNLLGYEPVIRVDYQPTSSLRGSFKFFEYQQAAEPILGTIPGWNDALALDFGTYAPAATFNWTLNSKTFVEASWGYNWHVQQGCGGISGSAPDFCRAANASNPSGNKVLAGLGDLPWIYPDEWVPEPGAYWGQVFRDLAKKGGTQWDGERVQSLPNFSWGSRVANQPPLRGERVPLASWTWTANATVTHVAGSHTLKAGYFYYNSRHIRGVVVPELNFANDTANSFDTTFGYANAATGVFNSFLQDSRYAEGDFRANNREAFVQDNWKVSSNLTLDYGLRFVNQTPVYDARMKTANFLPDRWQASKAPLMYQAGCSTGVYPCATAARVARNPQTGQLLGAGSALLVGTRVKGTGEALNGLFSAGQGIDDRLYVYPALSLAPRVGAAWDIRGDRTFVARGGFGVFYDRSNTNQLYDSITNPPFDNRTTLRYGLLQTLQEVLASAPDPAVALWAIQDKQDLFSSVQWSGGVQFTVPFSVVIDAAYTGQHSENGLQTVNINNIDLGTAFLPQYQNPAAANPANMTDPATSYATTNPDVIRFYQGYGPISQRKAISSRSYHSIQLSANRRFNKGLAFGFYDTIGLYDRQTLAPRLQHNADGTVTVRSDQARAQELLGNQNPQDHLMRANFTWELPKIAAGTTPGRRALASLVNGWRLSGIWNGSTGSYYAVSASYQSGGSNVNLTGSPDYGARVEVLSNADLGGGCSSDPLHQFNTAAFRGPSTGSVGLESGNGYLKGCFISSMDLAIARTIQAGKGYTIELRADVFNAFNQAGITGRNTTMSLSNPSDRTTITNLPNEATGVRTKPVGAGFGVATTYQDPRSAQIQLRLSF